MKTILTFVLVLSAGCDATNTTTDVAAPDMLEPSTAPDMKTPSTADMLAASTDMSHSADMMSVVSDMAPSSTPDMQPCPGTDVYCSSVCVNTSVNPNNCGFCGNVCASGSTCIAGACLFTHTDSFCSSTWTDTNATVNAADSGTALKVCLACCNSLFSASCACNVYTGFDSIGNAYKAYTFTPSFNLADTYLFYYYDDTAVGRVGAAQIASSNPSDARGGRWDR